MKNIMILALFIAVPAVAEEVKPTKEACRAQATFKYNFEMMKIEGDEIRNTISHREADEQKSKRHETYKEELEDCDDQ